MLCVNAVMYVVHVTLKQRDNMCNIKFKKIKEFICNIDQALIIIIIMSLFYENHTLLVHTTNLP